MITFKNFISKYDGKQVEVAGSANAQNQCVDLANAYIREVLDDSIVTGANAIDFPERVNGNYEWYPYKSGNVPEYGDIIIWNLNRPYGHIAMFIEGNGSRFTSFDQNWTKKEFTRVESHNYNGVRGWLRHKYNKPTNNSTGTPMNEQEKIQLEAAYRFAVEASKGVDKFRQRREDGAILMDINDFGGDRGKISGRKASASALAALLRGAQAMSAFLKNTPLKDAVQVPPMLDKEEGRKDKYEPIKNT